MSVIKKIKIGFIGQGFIGKNYADDFEKRGFDVVRYSLEEPYIKNKREVSFCDIVFIAVPTPTKPDGFDFSIVRQVLSLVGKQKVAVIKSTLLPGITKLLQKEFQDIFVLHSPEFLREVSAACDAANPERNIVGIPVDEERYKDLANEVLSVLPGAPFSKVCSSDESELIKYVGNNFLYMKVVYMNVVHDVASKLGCDFSIISQSVSFDSRIGKSHMNPVHDSGRGAGGNCFIKDFSAFRKFYEETLPEEDSSINFLYSVEQKNIDLLKKSNKNLDLLKGVYGDALE